jgi:hypothetical protein
MGLLLAVTAGPGATLAEGAWRCGGRLVQLGLSPLDVLERCGEPGYSFASAELVTVRVEHGVEVTEMVPVESWIYDRGPYEFTRRLIFRNGYLEEIVTGGYGG